MNNAYPKEDLLTTCLSANALISLENSDYIAEAFPFKIPLRNEETGQVSVGFRKMALFLFDKSSGEYNYMIVSPRRSPGHGRVIDANDVIKEFEEGSKKSLDRVLRRTLDGHNREFILKAIETVEGTAESMNVIDLFRKDGKHSNAAIDNLERDYLAYKGAPEIKL